LFELFIILITFILINLILIILEVTQADTQDLDLTRHTEKLDPPWQTCFGPDPTQPTKNIHLLDLTRPNLTQPDSTHDQLWMEVHVYEKLNSIYY